MIGPDDIEAFRRSNDDALRAAAKYVERQKRGLPPDRWASADYQHAVAQGIQAQWAIMAMMAEAITAMHSELERIRREAVQ